MTVKKEQGLEQCLKWDPAMPGAATHQVPVSLADVLNAGVAPLGDDACEPGGPSGVHLDPLGLRVILGTPCPTTRTGWSH